MNIDYLKNKIYPMNKEYEETLKIQPGEYIPYEVMNMLKDALSAVRLDCFAKADPKNPYEVEVNCPECGKLMINTMSKNAVLDYLSKTKSNDRNKKNKSLDKYLCDSCKHELQRTQQELLNKQEMQRLQQIENNTQEYIKAYLTPNVDWKEPATWRQRMAIITNMRDVNEDIIVEHIKQMQYKHFLQTLYWATISMHKKYKTSYKCSICGSNKNLSTHHSTYENHGYEHCNSVINQDLIVLCQDCHNKFHDKLPTFPV